jgi:integration host factor subunit alpha
MPALNNTEGTLTRADLAQAVSTKTNDAKWRSAELVDAVLEVIKETLESGEDVLMSGFGKFSIRKKQERRGRNPQTGEPIMVPPRKVVTFKYAGVLQDKINGKREL